jgi:hypothetical protein
VVPLGRHDLAGQSAEVTVAFTGDVTGDDGIVMVPQLGQVRGLHQRRNHRKPVAFELLVNRLHHTCFPCVSRPPRAQRSNRIGLIGVAAASPTFAPGSHMA